jgi:hypothetical protein
MEEIMKLLTKKLIYAASANVAERSRRSRGLAAWDEEAYDAACAEFNRLFEAIGGPEGWQRLPSE